MLGKCLGLIKDFNIGIYSNTINVINGKHWDLLKHHKCDKWQTLHDGTTPCALPFQASFGDLDRISKSQQRQTVLTENYVFLSS